MSRALGIDLSAAAKGTFACILEDDECGLTATIEGGCDDRRLRELGSGCTKVGIDAPFGWPAAFVDAISAYSSSNAWPADPQGESNAFRATLRYRATDRIVAQTRPPLSVSTDRLGVTAMRCAQLLDGWSKANIDRTGRKRFVEVYPAGALVRWGISASGYKTADRGARKAILSAVTKQLPALSLPAKSREACLATHDGLDALIAALVARAASIGLCTPPPKWLEELARVEGWIHLPLRGSLPLLAGSRQRAIKPNAAAAEAFKRAGGKLKGGYAARFEDALLPSFPAKVAGAVRADLEHKGGSELKPRRRGVPAKFFAPHSSAALAANTFGPFLNRSDRVTLLGRAFDGDRSLEAECPTGISRVPPTLDFLVEGTEILAVESKFTEYFGKQRAEFRDEYADAVSDLHRSWRDEYHRLVDDPERYRYLKAAQLVKHCLGLRRTYGRRPITLAYLYWEPSDAEKLAPCLIHRAEVQEFANRVADPRISFVSISHSELRNEWTAPPAPAWLRKHGQALQRRYEFSVAAQ